MAQKSLGSSASRSWWAEKGQKEERKGRKMVGGQVEGKEKADPTLLGFLKSRLQF